jgi:DNA-binding CsgD family transcriptional regulator
MITGVMTSSENLELALLEGAIDFLRKPFDKTEFQARVRSVMMLSDSMSELREKYLIIDNNSRFIRSLIDSVPHPVVWYSIDGILAGCNQQFSDKMDIQDEDIGKTVIYRKFEADKASLHLSHDLDLLSTRVDNSYECTMEDGGDTYLFSKSLYYNSELDPVGILCIIIDITEIKKLHRKLMDGKRKELISSSLRLIQINEINNQLIKELASLNQYTSQKGSEMIRKIIKEFSLNIGDGVWKDFEARFEQVYEGFYQQLLKQFPDLTPGERKLSAFLRMNISTKDIAIITMQNPQSVDMARYRLRKKLKLETDENLVDFLMTFEI